MKSFKKWLFAFVSALMVLGAATACSNSETEGTDTEQTDNGTQADNSTGSDTEDSSAENQ